MAKNKSTGKGTTLTLTECIEIMERSGNVGDRSSNRNRKKLSDWVNAGYVKRISPGKYDGRSLIRYLIKKKAENLTSNREITVDTDLITHKTLRKKYKADYETMIADIYEREQLRKVYVSQYINDILVKFKSALIQTGNVLQNNVYGLNRDEITESLEKTLSVGAYAAINESLTWEGFMKFIDECEEDRES